MTYSIILQKAWRYRHPRNGRSVLQAGRYRVPDDVPDVVAERAVAEGMAKREATFGEIFTRPLAKAAAAVLPAPAKPKKTGARRKSTAAPAPAA
jgi:hypothetical protein